MENLKINKFKKIEYFIFLILFASSTFYLSGITSFSPIYFLFFFSASCILTLAIFERLSFNLLIIYNIYIFISIMLIQIPIAGIRRPFVSFLCHLYFVFIYWSGNHLSFEKIIKGSITAIKYIIIFYLIELAIRINFRINDAIYALTNLLNNNYFYNFKENSIIFMDSNHVAIVLLAIYFMLIYLKKEFKINLLIYIVIVFILILFTYSRASIIATISFTFIYAFIRPQKIENNKIAMIIIILLIVLSLKNIITMFSEDASLLSKFYIFEQIIKYTKTSNIKRLIIGVGYGNSPKFIGIGTHNLFFTYYIEGGILSLIEIISLYVYMLYKFANIAYVLIPFIFAGLSFSPSAQTYLYCIIAIIILLEKKLGENGHKRL
jgi:hypothetical protein